MEKTVRETNQKITQLKREQMKEKLFGEGIVFEKNRQVQLKHDFTPTIGSLKLIPNKSGKTATYCHFTLARPSSSFSYFKFEMS